MAQNHLAMIQLIGAFAATNPDFRAKKKALGDLSGEMDMAGWIRNMDWKAIREEIALHDPGMATKLYELLQGAGMIGEQEES